MKTWIKVLVVVVALVGALVVTAYALRNTVAVGIARAVAPAVLGVPVEIGAVDLDVFGGAVTVEGVAVGNPKGFAAPHALTAKRIHVALSGESSPSRLVVDLVQVKGVEAWFILDGTDNNISRIVSGMSTGSGDAKPASDGAGVEVLIRKLQLQELAVHVSERPDAAEVPVLASIDEIEVRDVSSRSASGDLAAQLTAKVFETSMAAVVAQMGSKMPAAIADGVTKSLGNAGVVVTEVFQGATKGIQDAAKGVGDAVKGIGDGLGGVFGGKK
ncbi:MAG: hypothetical protein RI990_2086 [Planctomycetota bacterium]|jgi:hypothetical protein